MSNIGLFQFVKCKYLVVSLSFMIVNDQSLGCGVLVGQKKQFENASLHITHPQTAQLGHPDFFSSV